MSRELTAWVVTDGKAGDEMQCLGVAEALGLSPEIRRVAPRAPYTWLMPWGPIDPREAPSRTGSPMAAPFPDLLVASGRRAVPYLRTIRRASEKRTFTVMLKDPRTGLKTADLIWVPAYDSLRGDNVVTTLTSPHRVSGARLAAARSAPDPRLCHLPKPRVAVLAGGNSRHLRYEHEDILCFTDRLENLARSGASLMVTTSRRTPPSLRTALLRLVRGHDGFFWDGTGENPYVALLALADAVVVTAHSANMVGEATATGAQVLVFELPSGYERHRTFIEALEVYGAVKRFTGKLESFAYRPLDSTPVIAEAVMAGLARHRRALGLLETD